MKNTKKWYNRPTNEHCMYKNAPFTPPFFDEEIYDHEV
jgi:hypothetical protein